jgi:flagellar basal-body rod modification protein FlgD
MQALHHPITSPVHAMSTPSSPGSSSGSTNGSSAADSDASITANDFLTLLVAEMKNQDPTADTDPNAYIDQLVQVNSLQQLIQINQDLGGLGGDSSTTSSSGSGSASGSSSGSSESSNPSSQAMSAASRLATSLTAKHPQPGSADGSAVVQSQSAAPQAATAFQTELHKS